MKPIGTVSIVITCHGAATDLPIILGSLSHQFVNEEGRTPMGKPIKWLRGMSFAYYPIEVIVASDGEYLGPPVASLPMSVRVIECEKNGGVGHHTRGDGIKAASGEWIVLTNADNYFMGGWLHRLVETVTEQGGHSKVGMVYWNCISNLWGWSDFGGSKLRRAHIDLSCGAVRSDIAQRVGFPFRNYDGDFDYLKACASRAERLNLSVIALDETLVVHN